MESIKMARGQEKISVIVPVYNVEAYLQQCVDSILAQTWQNLEIILVDDGSSDNCGAICDEYAVRNSHVAVIHQKNSGLSAARNAGIKRATGEYLSFVDSDDFIAPTMLEILYERMQETSTELVLCNMQYTNEAGELIEGKNPAQRYKLPEAVWTQEQFWEQKRKNASGTYVVSCSKLYARRLFDAVRFPEKKKHEDEFILHRIIDQCSKIAVVSQSLYFYRQREGSITNDPLNPDRLDTVEALLERSDYFRQKKDWKSLKKTMLYNIDLLEWFAYESELAGRPLPERYESLKQQVIKFACRPVPSLSPIYGGGGAELPMGSLSLPISAGYVLEADQYTKKNETLSGWTKDRTKKEKQQEKISVIVPVYKVEPYLRQCVDSILAQTWQNLEIILVDDGSPDNCGAICDEYAVRDSRIVVIHQKNGGLSAARNAGIKRATGQYLSFVDSDDFIAPTMLETLYKRMRETSAELVLCNIQYVDETGNNISKDSRTSKYGIAEEIWSQKDFWKQKSKNESTIYVVTWNKLYSRRLFATVRYPIGKTHEDEFVLHRIIDQCRKIATVSKSLYFYRQRKDSITADPLNPDRLDVVEALLERSNYFCQKKDWKLLKKTVFYNINFLEWFAYESELAGRALPEQYESLKQQVIEFTCRPVRIFSPVYWGVVLSYRWGVFPYKLLRNLYWSVVNWRKKCRKVSSTR